MLSERHCAQRCSHLAMINAKSVSSRARGLAGVVKSTIVEFEVLSWPLPEPVTILRVVFSLGEIAVMFMLSND